MMYSGKNRAELLSDLVFANQELIFLKAEIERRKDELFLENKKLVFQNTEKENSAVDLIIANKELVNQNKHKEERASELRIANIELAFQNREKEKRAAELIIANKELAFQNGEKEKRASELIIANIELAFQNSEKEKRATELIVANKELAFQSKEKEKRAAELIIANIELASQNKQKEERANDLVYINKELQQLLKLNKDRDKFFAIIAHDLKGPINTIVGLSEILVEQIKEKDDDEMGECANLILQSSKRVMDLLTNLLLWARLQSGRMDFNPEYFDLIAIINEVTLLLNGIAEQKSIVIASKLPTNIQVYADKEMISSVLRNLITNAIKFTQTEGRITILAVTKQNELTISVSDNGVGISQDRIDKLFIINESNSSPGTQNEKGTGLGLILCKEFIEKNNGKIWVESKVGIETTFYFSLPLYIENK